MSGKIVADWSGGVAYMFSQVEEDVDTRLKWEGCRGLQYEVRDGVPLDRFLLIV